MPIMSFQNKNFWLRRDAGCLTDGKMGFETSSKVEQKRAHQWDLPEREFFCNKKQAVESFVNIPISATENVKISLWDNASSYQSVSGFSDHLFVPESIRTSDLACKTISSAGTGNLHMERKGFIPQFDNNSAINIVMTHAMEDPLCGIGKANVNQVRDSRNGFSMSMVQPHIIGENNKITSTAHQRSNNSIALQPKYQKVHGNAISLGPTFNEAEDNTISMGQTVIKGGTDFMLMGHHYDRENNGMLSVEQPFNKWNCSFISMDQQYGKENINFMSNDPAYDKKHEDFIMMDPTCDKACDKAAEMLMVTSVATQKKEDATAVSMGVCYGKHNSSISSMAQNCDEGDATTISFGPEISDISLRLISSSDVSTKETSVKVSEAPARNDLMGQNVDQVGNVASTSTKTDDAPKNKGQKKMISTNNFPSNVKSMLSTGIFDGVPVKYVSWSREKNLLGVIKGTGYLCSCETCDHSKVLNAYEFECHAGVKTKHPNNHIYFENGKTVYAAVQELKSIPQEMLFEAIESVTGSPINQKNFRLWKVSYQAATRELERIYGKDDAFKLS